MEQISVEEAKALWRQAVEKRPRVTETIDLVAARGRVLAQEVKAPFDVPAFNKSAMDGYAVRYEEGRTDYTIVGLIGAGLVWDKPVDKGQAVRIMTGAAVPADCDTVIMQEGVETTGQVGDFLHVKGAVTAGQHVIGRAEECKEGTPLLAPGILIDSAVQSVLAGLGLNEVQVYAPLKALLLTSGREVVEPGQALGPGQIYNSNRFLLEGLLRDQGIEHISHYHVSDDPELLEQEVQNVVNMAQDVDLIVSTGGVSVGLFDSMPHIYQALGAQVLYHRISMRPGAASYGAVTPKGLLIFGLSGNPVAAYNGFQLLAKEALQLARGCRAKAEEAILCVSDCDFTKKNPLDRYVQGRVYSQEGTLRFTLSDSMSSSAMVSLATVNALAYVPQGTKGVKTGDLIRVFLTKPL
ncbi:MAG: molybdopterin molybdotransferase MoeA [Veillonella sp.]|nr:molybdopterin molybdotransferase MoeA [Veillonella sp.]